MFLLKQKYHVFISNTILKLFSLLKFKLIFIQFIISTSETFKSEVNALIIYKVKYVIFRHTLNFFILFSINFRIMFIS